MTLGQKEQIAQLTAKLEKLKMERQPQPKRRQKRLERQLMERNLRQAQSAEAKQSSRKRNVMGSPAKEQLGYSDFADSQGGQGLMLEKNWKNHGLDSNCTSLALQFVDPRTYKGAALPGWGAPTFRKQSRLYEIIQAATGVSGSLGNAIMVLPDPETHLVGFSTNDQYFTGTAGTGTGFIGVQSIPGWADLDPNVYKYRCVGLSVLLSPVEDLLQRGGIVQGAYFSAIGNDPGTWSSTGTPGKWPMDLSDSGIGQFDFGSRHPLSVGMYGFWTPIESANAQFARIPSASGVASLPGLNGALVFQITGASDVSPGDNLMNIEIIANWEFSLATDTLSSTVDRPFGSKVDTISHALSILYDHPRFVANDSHVEWIKSLKNTVKSVPSFLKEMKKYASAASDAAELFSFL